MNRREIRLEAVAPRVSEIVDPRFFGDELVEHYSIPSLEATGRPEVVRAADIGSAKQRLRGGEVMVSRLNPRKARVIAVPTVRRLALASGEFVVLAPHGIEPRFLTYLLLSEKVRQYLDSRVQSVTRSHQRVRPEVLLKMRVLVPGRSDQRAIADYLDTETSRIDTLITKKRRMIELLEERKRLLGQEVFANLSLSEELRPMKHLVDESDVRHGTAPEPTMLAVSIHHGVVRRDAVTDRPMSTKDISRYKVCRTGDIVINRMRAFQGGVGVVREDGVVSPDYTVLHVGPQVSGDYLHFLMRSPWFVSEMTRRLRGIGAADQGQVRTPRINFADLGLIQIPVPAIAQQRLISRNLAEQEALLADLNKTLTKQVEVIVERRQTVITTAVTGESSLQ